MFHMIPLSVATSACVLEIIHSTASRLIEKKKEKNTRIAPSHVIVIFIIIIITIIHYYHTIIIIIIMMMILMVTMMMLISIIVFSLVIERHLLCTPLFPGFDACGRGRPHDVLDCQEELLGINMRTLLKLL